MAVISVSINEDSTATIMGVTLNEGEINQLICSLQFALQEVRRKRG